MALLAAVSLTLMAGVPSAAGLEPGVHVDPGSPAAKEYALPLDQVRQIGQEGSARGGSGQSGSAQGGSTQLFGAGISSTRQRGQSKATTLAAGGHAGRDAIARHRTVAGASTPASAVLSRQASPGGGGDSTLALIGGGVLVLALAAFLGVVLRGRRGAHPN